MEKGDDTKLIVPPRKRGTCKVLLLVSMPREMSTLFPLFGQSRLSKKILCKVPCIHEHHDVVQHSAAS